MLGISTILLFLLIVSLMTIGHELGHFLVARFFGLQTPVFGLGLPWGPSWVIGHKWDTQLRVHLLLFGGYVSIPELDPAPPDETSPAKPLRNFPLWQRILVVLAGVGFYIVFAWMALFVSLNAAGEPNQRVVVQDLSPTNPIAASAGVKRGDQIVAIDSKQVSSPDEIVSCLRLHPAKPVIVRVLRQEHELELPITSDSRGRVGMSLGIDISSSYRRIVFIESFGRATHNLYKMTTDIYRATGAFLESSAHKQAAGPAAPRAFGMRMIVIVGADIIAKDLRQLGPFVAMISIDMAILNLMPWPGFDGSHLLAIIFNALRKRPLPQAPLLGWAFIGCLVLSLLSSGAPLCLLRGHHKPSKN